MSSLGLQERTLESLRPPYRLWVSGRPDWNSGTSGLSEPEEATLRREQVRRLLNMLIAIAGLVLSIPVLLLIALLLKLTSPGPVLYTQPRVGMERRGRRKEKNGSGDRRREDCGGRIFTLYKFRTMHVGADGGGQVWARPGDARVTTLGRYLRRYRLDELPQLWNVLLGDMNIVGPRPEQPAIFRELCSQLPDYALRQQVLPGITGWAQVNQDADCNLEDVRRKLRYDLEYVERCSPAEDLRIMFRTFPVMLGARGW